MFAQFMRCLASCWVVAILTLMGWSAAFGSQPEDQPAALHNPILRAYFRSRVRTVSPHQRSNPVLERSIDQMIRQYLKVLIRKRNQLRASLEMVIQSRERFVANNDSGAARIEALRVWRSSLNALARDADQLRGAWDQVFRLSYNKTRRPDVDEGSANDAYRREVDSLRDQVDRIEERINNYLLGGKPVIAVEDLRTDNLVALLTRVRRLSRELRNRLTH